jgi:hypothetical protein
MGLPMLRTGALSRGRGIHLSGLRAQGASSQTTMNDIGQEALDTSRVPLGT